MDIGFIGFGKLGSGIAIRLIEAGHAVTGWNRTRAKAEPALAAGMAWADRPRAGESKCAPSEWRSGDKCVLV